MWLIFAIAATVLFSAYDILSRVLASRTVNPVVYSGIYCLFVSVFSIFLCFFEPLDIENGTFSLEFIFLCIIGLAVWAAFTRVEYVARKLNEVSRLMVIFRIAPVITFFFAVIFLGESLTWQKGMALFLTLIANVVVVFSGLKRKSTTGINRKGVLIGIIASIFLGLGWSFDKVLSSHLPLPLYTFSVFFFSGIVTLLVPPVGKKVIIREFNEMSIIGTAVLALINVVGFFLYLRAFALGDVSSVIIVTSSATVIAILLGIVLLKERDDIPYKILGGVMVLIATVILS